MPRGFCFRCTFAEKTKTMKKRKYEKPELTTMCLCDSAALLAGSRGGTLGGYTDPNDDEWSDD